MGGRILEAELVIGAKDQTGAATKSVSGNLRRIANAAKSVGNVSVGAISQTSASLARLDKRTKLMAGAVAGSYLAHGIGHVVSGVTETYAHFDDLVRYQRAITGMTKDQQKPFIEQAIKGGGSTPFNDLQWLEAQLDLMQRGVNKDFVIPITKMAADYAQAMNAELPDAAKTVEGILFSTRKHIEDGNEALKVSQHTVDYAVKLAKIGGLDNDDVKSFFKYGGMPGAAAGLSDETIGAMAALMRRSNIRGDEAGVAVRSFASHLVAPTQKGRNALLAMGLNYDNYTKMPDALSVDRLGNFVKQNFGKAIDAGTRKKLAHILADEAVIGDKGEFTTQVSAALSGLFEHTKKGKLKPQDAKALAKTAGDFYKMSVESVDSERLLHDIIAANPSLQQLNAFFTDKQGARFAAIMAGGIKLFDDYRKKLQEAPQGFSGQIADERMGGFSGAKKRLEGSYKNVETALGRAFDAELTGTYNALAHFMQSIAEADSSVLKFGTEALGTVAALIGLKAAIKAFHIADKLAGGAGAVGALPVGTVASVLAGGAVLSHASADMVFNHPRAFKGVAEGGMLGAMAPEGWAISAAIANNLADHEERVAAALTRWGESPAMAEKGFVAATGSSLDVARGWTGRMPVLPGQSPDAQGPTNWPTPRPAQFPQAGAAWHDFDALRNYAQTMTTPAHDMKAVVEGPVTATLEGGANVAVTVKVEAGDGLLGRISSMVSSAWGHIRTNGAPASGTSGSTGTSMTETGMPQP